MPSPCLAAITLDPKGGGVAAVSRLLRDVLTDTWGDVRVHELVRSGSDVEDLESSFVDRLRFGAGLAWRQAFGGADWILYSHLAVAQVQGFVPLPVRRPYAVFLHGIEVWDAVPTAGQKILAGAALRLSNSRFTARRVAAALPHIGPIEACPLALPRRSGSAPASPDLPFDLGPHAVIVVGRMLVGERYKGHDEVLAAWPEVKRRVPDARLVFVGGGDDGVRLREKASTLGIAEDLTLTGFVSAGDVMRMYERAALLAMPSRGEGFGLVYLEAMSHRLPCIGSIHDAAGEVIEDGVTGFLVDQADIPALADRISTLLLDDGRRKEMGASGYARLEQHFTYKQFADRLVPHLQASFGRSGRVAPAASSIR